MYIYIIIVLVFYLEWSNTYDIKPKCGFINNKKQLSMNIVFELVPIIPTSTRLNPSQKAVLFSLTLLLLL